MIAKGGSSSRARANLLIERVAPEATLNCAGLGRARDLLIGFAEEFARPRTTINIDPVSLL